MTKKKKKQQSLELTDLCQAVQSRYTNDADIRRNHKYEQYDAYPQDHTSYLTAKGTHKAEISLLLFF